MNLEQKHTDLINAIDGIVWECNPDNHRFTFISDKVFDILGYTKEQWLADDNFWRNHLYEVEKDFIINRFKIFENSFEKHQFEYQMVAADGKIIWIRDIVSPMLSDAGYKTSLRGIMIDITESKKVESDLQESFRLVSDQNKRMLNFSHLVSHNLRSHTSNIQSIINLIEITSNTDEQQELFGMLKIVSIDLDETIYKLHEMINVQNTANIILKKTNLKQHIEKAIFTLENIVFLNKAEIENKVSHKINIMFNPAYLDNILINLLLNSIKFKHPERNPKIIIDTEEDEDFIILIINDNGIGIDMHKNGEKIFGLFQALHNNKASRQFGLFMSKSQIETMKGKISVESELDKGSVFKIHFRKIF